MAAVHEKQEAGVVNVSEQDGGSSHDASLIEQQTRTRRLFSYPQLFAFSLVYLGTWYCTAM